MKPSIKALVILFLASFTVTGYSQAIKVSDTGKVGINGEPSTSYNLKVTGTLNTTGAISCSSLIMSLGVGTITTTTTGIEINKSGLMHVGINGAYASNCALKVNGENNTYALYIEGSAYASGGTWQASDERLKKNIKSADPTMIEKLAAVDVKEYEFKTRKELLSLHKQGILKFEVDTITTQDTLTGQTIQKLKPRIPRYPEGKQRGVMAEELKAIFPELVKFDETAQLYAVNYSGFIPVLIESVKEQQKQIKSLEARIVALENKLSR